MEELRLPGHNEVVALSIDSELEIDALTSAIGQYIDEAKDSISNATAVEEHVKRSTAREMAIEIHEDLMLGGKRLLHTEEDLLLAKSALWSAHDRFEYAILSHSVKETAAEIGISTDTLIDYAIAGRNMLLVLDPPETRQPRPPLPRMAPPIQQRSWYNILPYA
jgi:hypothetical protein